MKNEIELNVHLFFPEQRNDEISAEQHKALETLLALPELDQKDSVEKFIAELESRLALIKPILGDQTEEFLGYNQDDITKLADFFAGKFKRFGMDAVAVQKILRNIWLRTPREDKRLNYNLYKFIDEKFYSIVNERKRNISFDHIPAPTDSKWVTLKKDWEDRRAHYAQELQIDIDYLDGEAVDGTIFPSASGLFANPVPLGNNEPDYKILEYLNFWMLNVNIRHNKIPTRDICSGHWGHKYFDFLRSQNSKFIDEDNDCFHYLYCKIKFVEQEYTNTLSIIEDEFYSSIQDKYSVCQPSGYFRQYLQSAYYNILYENEIIFSTGNDSLQLPNFINTCQEYVLSSGRIKYSKSLRFRDGKKIYFPLLSNLLEDFIECAEIFNSLKKNLPPPYTLNEYTIAEYVHMLNDYFLAADPAIQKWEELMDSSSLINHKMQEFCNRILDFVRMIKNDDNLSEMAKNIIIICIRKLFDKYDSIAAQLHDEDPNIALDNQCDIITRICEWNLAEKEAEKLKLQLKEAETKAQVQKDNFVTINHSIKNLISSVDGALSRLERRLPSDQEFMCNLLKQAKQGVVIASDLANAITCSYRQTGTEAWHEDLLPENAKWSIRDILHDALSASIPHMFFRRYSQYEQESKNYFPDKDEVLRAESEWYDLPDIPARVNWINQHLFRFELNEADVANVKVGNKYSTKTHLYVFLNEILLNAIKAASFVDKERRNIKVSLTSAGGNIIVDISNSANPNRGISGGYGKIIIDNYKSMFNMPDFYSGYDTNTQCYQVKFTLPFSK